MLLKTTFTTHFAAWSPTTSLSADEASLLAGEVAKLETAVAAAGGWRYWYFCSMAFRSCRRRSSITSSSSESGSMSRTLGRKRGQRTIHVSGRERQAAKKANLHVHVLFSIKYMYTCTCMCKCTTQLFSANLLHVYTRTCTCCMCTLKCSTHSSSDSLFSLSLLPLECDLDRPLPLPLSLSLSLSLSLPPLEGDHLLDRRSTDLDRLLDPLGLRERERYPRRGDCTLPLPLPLYSRVYMPLLLGLGDLEDRLLGEESLRLGE